MRVLTYITPLLLSLFTSCTREEILLLDPVPPRLVLNATFTPGQDVSAFLSKSWFLLDSVPDYELSGAAAIRVYVNEVLKGSMRCSDNPNDSLSYRGQYVLPGCRLQEGDRVRLEAESPGFNPVVAETRIPDKTDILKLDTFRYYASGNPCMRIATHFKDDPKERNYYRLIVEKVTEYWKGDSVKIVSTFASSIYWSFIYLNGFGGDSGDYGSDYFGLHYEDPAFQPSGSGPALNLLEGTYCRGVFPDDLFEGKAYAVKSVVSYPTDSYKGDSITSLVHYDIHLLSISSSYYNYLRIIRGISLSFGIAYQDGLVEPTATFTNVTDGFGVVAGYQISSKRIDMPFGTKEPFWTPWDKMD